MLEGNRLEVSGKRHFYRDDETPKWVRIMEDVFFKYAKSWESLAQEPGQKDEILGTVKEGYNWIASIVKLTNGARGDKME